MSGRLPAEPNCALKRRHRFNADGVVIVEYALSGADLAAFDQVVERWRPKGGGGRDVLGEDKDFVSRHLGLHDLASSLIQEPMMLLRAVSFEKSAAANWFVPWHQDRSRPIGRAGDTVRLPMGQACPADEFEISSRNQVEFSPAILRRMVTLRVHLDDCGEDDGPLEVALGSHGYGALRREAVARQVAQSMTGVCLSSRGDIVAMSPLLLHRSQRARSPNGRRKVLHLEYAPRASIAEGIFRGHRSIRAI